MEEIFEFGVGDAAGRLGELSIPRANVTVETPALLPVINPHLPTVEANHLGDFGAEMLITNAYILHQSDQVRDEVESKGLHEFLGFDGAIMTDSGAFQLAEYGSIDVTTEEILRFQQTIGADVGTPIDIPTPPDAPRERAAGDLETTQNRLELAAELDLGEMLVAGPIQGSTYPDLREGAASHAQALDFDLYPIGAVVPLMTDYRYADVVAVVVAAKRGLGIDAPVHLFGAGHPMMFALAVAMGCDLFDSAAYARFARDDRYLTVHGTRHLDELACLPCPCQICAEWTAGELQDAPEEVRRARLAEHNLAVSFAEMDRVKAALRAGNLLELVEVRARAHPTMLDGYRALLEEGAWLERSDPVRKGTFFYLSSESASRPEVVRHHQRLDRLNVAASVLLIVGNPDDVTDYRDEFDAIWPVSPPFGPYPPDLSETYPLTVERPERLDHAALEQAAEGIARLVELNPQTDCALRHPGWPKTILERLPDTVRLLVGADESGDC